MVVKALIPQQRELFATRKESASDCLTCLIVVQTILLLCIYIVMTHIYKMTSPVARLVQLKQRMNSCFTRHLFLGFTTQC